MDAKRNDRATTCFDAVTIKANRENDSKESCQNERGSNSRKRINYAKRAQIHKGSWQRQKRRRKKSSQCVKETGPGMVLRMGDGSLGA